MQKLLRRGRPVDAGQSLKVEVSCSFNALGFSRNTELKQGRFGEYMFILGRELCIRIDSTLFR